MIPFRFVIFCLLSLTILLSACGGGEDDTPDLPTPITSPTLSIASLRVEVSEALVFRYPSRDAEVLFRLIEGDITTPLAQTEPDLLGVTWYQVGQGETFGWVAGSQVVVTGDTSSIRTVGDTIWNPSPTPLEENFVITATPVQILNASDPFITIDIAQASVLDAPSRTADTSSQLFQGDTVDPLGRFITDEDTFYLVGREGFVVGWVLASQVTVFGDESFIPILEDVQGDLDKVLTNLTPQPSPTVPSPIPSLTPTEAPPTEAVLAPTLVPTNTPRNESASEQPIEATSPPTPSIEPSLTPTLDPLQGIPPPFSITTPDDWIQVDVLVPIDNAYLQGAIPLSAYQGTLQDGAVNAFIWVAWGFPNVTSPSGEINIYGDGVQILRGIMFNGVGCQLGLGEGQREHQVGGLAAPGNIYSVVDCQNSPDTAGLFAALQVGGGNFAFVVGVEPPSAVNEALPQLQAMLDSVIFNDLESDNADAED